jgi:hypothetical protein
MKKLLKVFLQFGNLQRCAECNIFYDAQYYVIIVLNTKVEMIGQIEEEERVESSFRDNEIPNSSVALCLFYCTFTQISGSVIGLKHAKHDRTILLYYFYYSMMLQPHHRLHCLLQFPYWVKRIAILTTKKKKKNCHTEH